MFKMCKGINVIGKYISPFGKCTTFLPDNFFKKTIYLDTNVLEFHQNRLFDEIINKINFLKLTYIAHSQNTLPHVYDNNIEFRDNPNKFVKLISLTRYEFHRLPKPYDTQCHEYSANDTQSHCLNKCYQKAYESRYKCIPKQNSLLIVRLLSMDILNLILPFVRTILL